MSRYQISLPWPPTVNTYWRHGRGRHYISARGMQYRKDITHLIRQQQLNINTTARLRFFITAYPPDKRRRDLDNLQKAVFDSLVHAGFMVDDGQIDDFRVRRGVKSEGGRLEIFITELETA